MPDSNNYMSIPVWRPKLQLQVLTTKPTTGLTKGEIFLMFHGSAAKIGVCTSTAAQRIKVVSVKNRTLGRLTN